MVYNPAKDQKRRFKAILKRTDDSLQEIQNMGMTYIDYQNAALNDYCRLYYEALESFRAAFAGFGFFMTGVLTDDELRNLTPDRIETLIQTYAKELEHADTTDQ